VAVSITTTEAARRLRVSPREVRRLIAAGDLTAESTGRFFLVDETSLQARARVTVRMGRALAPRTAWAALWEASGERAEWLDRSTRSRLRAWIRRHDGEYIAQACRRRAVRHDLRVLPAYLTAVVSDAAVVTSGMSLAGDLNADVVTAGEVVAEVYCAQDTSDRLRDTFKIGAAGQTNLVLRVPSFADPRVLDRDRMPVAVVAIDLLESADVRTRRAGTQLLDRAITENVW
jgi:excisionase family DNA binding protein